MGYSLDQIAPEMVGLGDGGTFAQLYAKLTSDSASNAWPKFQSAIQALPNGVTSDDPFRLRLQRRSCQRRIPQRFLRRLRPSRWKRKRTRAEHASGSQREA